MSSAGISAAMFNQNKEDDPQDPSQNAAINSLGLGDQLGSKLADELLKNKELLGDKQKLAAAGPLPAGILSASSLGLFGGSNF